MLKKDNLAIIFQEIFQVMLSGYLIFLLAETIKEGIISNFFNLNILLLIVLVSGVGTAIFPVKKEEKNVKVNTDWDFIYIWTFALLSGVIVYYKTYSMGKISYVISIIASVLVLLLTYIVINDKEGK